jgi:glutathione S-transferase
VEDSQYSEFEEQKEIEILFNIILPNLEESLDGGKYFLCGNDISIADIAYFNELTNILSVLEMEIDTKKYPNADRWIKRIESISAIRVNTIKFQEEWKKLKEKIQ